jgi:ABC-type thiamine transport system substrate-binding protein
MFVEPVNERAQLPEVFEANRTEIDEPLSLSPAEIEAGRDRWTERWTEIVLR